MTREQQRRQWLRRHNAYERLAYKKFIKLLREQALNVNYNVVLTENLPITISEDAFVKIYYEVYKEVGIIHGTRLGKQLNREIKDFTLNSFLSEFERNLLSWLYENSLSNIRSVSLDFVKYLQQFITEQRDLNKTVQEISAEMIKLINRRDFYRWQALRIARTETTAASNYASIQVGNTSRIVYQKMWLSATDARTRKPPKSEFNHLSMDGVKVEMNEKFKVPFNGGFQELSFAGDPKGSAGNVINCRCSNVLVPKRDANGNVIRKIV